MGWTAARNDLAPGACLLRNSFLAGSFHFYAIGWLYREDYARAGMLMLPAIDEDDGRTTFRRILISTQLPDRLLRSRSHSLLPQAKPLFWAEH